MKKSQNKQLTSSLKRKDATTKWQAALEIKWLIFSHQRSSTTIFRVTRKVVVLAATTRSTKKICCWCKISSRPICWSTARCNFKTSQLKTITTQIFSAATNWLTLKIATFIWKTLRKWKRLPFRLEVKSRNNNHNRNRSADSNLLVSLIISRAINRPTWIKETIRRIGLLSSSWWGKTSSDNALQQLIRQAN